MTTLTDTVTVIGGVDTHKHTHYAATNTERAAALPAWPDSYNLDRHHLGIGGIPINRIKNGRGQCA